MLNKFLPPSDCDETKAIFNYKNPNGLYWDSSTSVVLVMDSDGKCRGRAKFHNFSTDYEDDTLRNFPVAIVQWLDGTVELVYAKLIKFDLKREDIEGLLNRRERK